MSVDRSYDADALDRIVNHPEVHKWVALPGQGTLSSGEIVGDLKNILLMNTSKTGALLFKWQEPCIFEVHIQFLPNARGKSALKDVKEAVEYMFLRTEAFEILTQVPEGNPAADLMARAVGGNLDFHRAAVWDTEAGKIGANYYGLRFADWIRQADRLEVIGAEFHRQLTKTVPEADHDDDPAHDRRVGAAIEMVRHGQVDKALLLYNRWARFAGYAPVQLVSRQPVIIDICSAIIVVNSDGSYTAVEKK